MHDSTLHSIDKEHEKNHDCSNYQMDDYSECVWLHNLSQVPVFVTSPTLEPIPSESKEINPVKPRDQSIFSLAPEDSDHCCNRNASFNGKNLKIL